MTHPTVPPATFSWDPEQYAVYGTERGRPFGDLLARVRADAPAVVVDLGCGDGPLTLGLARRWPRARVIGVDSSAQMLRRAKEHDTDGRVEWVEGDLHTWQPSSLATGIDVMVSNAALQWVAGHTLLIPGWVESLNPGGWFAMSVPGNFDAPSHTLLREVVSRAPRGAELGPRLRGPDSVGDPATYAAVLAGLCREVDAWETTYLHILDPAGQQDSPVLEWTKGTALRPVLDVLTGEQERAQFLAEYADALAAAYPRQPFGTAMPFRRVFAVAHVPSVEVARSPRRWLDEHGGWRDDHGGVPMIEGLHHVQVSCPAGAEDVLRTFYVGVLGMVELDKPPALAARGGAWFRAGTAEIHCGVETPFVPARKAHPGILVSDVDAVARTVASAGGAVRWDDNVPGIRRFHTDDPVGNRLELIQA